MLNSQKTSNDNQLTSSDLNNDSLNDNLDNQKEEFLSNNNDNDNCKKTINRIRNGKIPKTDDDRKLLVGQLSSDITKEDREKYFSKFGSIEDVTIKYDVSGGRTRSFAFILFDDKESIQKVLNLMNRERSVCRPLGFVSFSSEKTAEEVLRQQCHIVNGASIEVRSTKPHPYEQQQLQMQQ
ncbi:unnamed protein product [Rotaria sp. Silwood2]|nr:unnamed protein product [Rotaria sp. Silwood2]CAF2563950.1 unnamed protein product [Rotaria sp. Silwood2]CAF2968382.1 unnamed protein product [Rotaria sp. Silwood2]CAF3860664.1 unnamed protein product [Rotaria sp. Silwood2]CAF4022544.1 unnamed protein product [Rotaria sp. Silwood2]